MLPNHPTFVPGLRLAALFFAEAVRPIIESEVPGLPYSAALLGYGSDVLGLDTPQSMDHEWGPRLRVFLPEEGFDVHRDRIDRALRTGLPLTFHGYSTNFAGFDPSDPVQRQTPIESGPVNHKVWIQTVPDFVVQSLGVDPRQPITLLDWLTFPEQRLLEVTAGDVFHDSLGELTAVRSQFAEYPRDVWLYNLASLWKGISQEEAFVGRCGDVGDELGSRLVAGRLVHLLMRLCFVMERCYAPYSKWMGTAFARLRCAAAMRASLDSVLAAADWREREQHLAAAYETVGTMHNRLGVTDHVDASPRPYHGRPYTVIHAERFAEAIKPRIDAAVLRRLPLTGSVDQLLREPDALQGPRLQRIKQILS